MSSFLDTGNRGTFGNANPAVQVHPDFALRRSDGEARAPLVVAGPQLERVRDTLRARSQARPTEVVAFG